MRERGGPEEWWPKINCDQTRLCWEAAHACTQMISDFFFFWCSDRALRIPGIAPGGSSTENHQEEMLYALAATRRCVGLLGEMSTGLIPGPRGDASPRYPLKPP